jgi:hypothetical protein
MYTEGRNEGQKGSRRREQVVDAMPMPRPEVRGWQQEDCRLAKLLARPLVINHRLPQPSGAGWQASMHGDDHLITSTSRPLLMKPAPPFALAGSVQAI